MEAEDGEEAFVPPAELRKTEVAANELLSVYGTQYYGSGAATSAYLWDQDGGGIAGCFLVRKGEWWLTRRIVWSAFALHAPATQFSARFPSRV